MKSLLELLSILQDAEKSLCIDTRRDWETTQSRIKHEGLSFATITLPRFSSWLEQSLEEGRALSTITSSFKALGGSVLPCYLQGLTKRVFDPVSGIVLVEADPKAIMFIRLFCNSFKKLKLGCTEKRNQAAIEKFLATDNGLPENIVLDGVQRSVAHVVVSSLRFFLSDDALPKHGPGATYERILGNQKYTGRGFYERWSELVDFEQLYGYSYAGSKPAVIVPRDKEQPCRLSLVPKTLKTPRLIAVEPAAMQYAQQYCASRLITSMRSSKYTRHLDFTDQSVNRALAKKGSIDGSVCTIDLSEASDRVSIALVKELFSADPELLNLLLGFRSKVVKVPARKGMPLRLHELKKYSTSGSALTFPVETLVFFILVLSTLVKLDLGRGVDLKTSISRLAQSVSVYGDDIVAPADACKSICLALEALGLKVNTGKTFSKGHFRESCGGDYFRGHDVTPVYIRHDLPSSMRETEAIVAAVANSNLFRKKGLKKTAATIRQHVNTHVYRLPVVLETSPGLGWWTNCGRYPKRKVLPNFHWGVRTLVSVSKRVADVIDGPDALLKHFLSKGVSEEADHLLRSVPRYSNRLKLKWTTPY